MPETKARHFDKLSAELRRLHSRVGRRILASLCEPYNALSVFSLCGPAALCHLISSARASCDCINTSLSRLDAVEILMADHRKRERARNKGGGGVQWGSPVQWRGLIFLIRVSTLA